MRPILRRSQRLASWFFLLSLAGSVPLPAQSTPAVPEPLRPWVAWVLDKHPDLPCPLLDDQRLCVWPGRLTLVLDDRGGGFDLEALVDRETDLPLPGGPALWPRDVRGGLLRRLGDQPAVRLPKGRHRVTGSFRWSRLPESLPVPRAVALVDLTLRGAAVAAPRRAADGQLWLEASREQAEQDRLGLEVGRRIEDGVPVTLTTWLRLRVSGSSRTVDLGSPLPPGFTLTGLGGELPVRWTAGEKLVVQARPGTWIVTLEARSRGPVTELPFLTSLPADVWPQEELWAFQADPEVRAVRVSGAPGIDPQRTALPEDWKGLPVFQLTPGTRLAFDELRRGETQPPPDAIDARRTWWLEQAGDRFTVSDRLNGQLFSGGRLEALAPGELGRFAFATAAGDQVITAAPRPDGSGGGRPGVEVRESHLEAGAELTYPRHGALPAVGWNRDVRSLGAELRLPPGWTLVAASGVDRAHGSWLDRWTLLDLFLLLILSLATWRLDGPRWGALAFVFLGCAWHEPHATGLWAWWLVLLPLRALLGVLPAARARLLRGLRWAAAAGFAVQLLVFVADQWRTGLFPQLESSGRSAAWTTAGRGYVTALEPQVGQEIEAPLAIEQQEAAPRSKKDLYPYRARQIDVNAVVQTGPGLPTWQWRSYSLSWNGPVTADQTMRFVLISPAIEWLLSMLRIAAAVVLAGCLIHPRRTPGALAPTEPPPAGGPPSGATVAEASILFLLALLAPWPAGAQDPGSTPAPDLLAELERRLSAPPDCHPSCVEVPHLTLAASPAGLTLRAEVHAAARAVWPLPGPAAAWTPARVTVDGERAVALRLGDDGFFLLRLEAGTHQVELAGAARDSLALEFPLRPRILDWQGDGWTIDGWRADEPPPGAVRLDRQLPLAGAGAAGLAVDGESALEPEPWLELERELDVGIPWLVHNQLRRRGPSGTVVLARVPLLPGESVTTAGITVENGEAWVGLEPEETVRRFESTLAETELLTLTAPADRPWLERWRLACSPIWSCTADGLAPIRRLEGDSWRLLWLPWPGEQVTLSFVRPAGVPGRTTTFERAELEVRPGRRLLEASLALELRASRGGEQEIRLPPAAALQSFTLDGRQHPVRAEGGKVAFTLEPGTHRLEATWRQDHRVGFFERVPEVGLTSETVNVTVRVEVPESRWLLWTGGPGWGPVVQFWQYLLVLALAAWALGRWAPAPLATLDWLLLGAGLTQVPLAAALFVVGWLLALALRHRLRPRRWWTWDALQLALLGVGVIALGVLYAAIHSGLLFQPDMQVLAPGSVPASSAALEWYVDRSGDTLPQPWLLSLPLWVWRILMLLWSLWLASRVLRWMPWCWQRLTCGPLLASPAGFRRWMEGESADRVEDR